jgi:polyketide biosynthesis enoyl-CoA hydratase PksH
MYRPDANNTINRELVAECREVVAQCKETVSVLVLEGLAETFCFGADFTELRDGVAGVSQTSSTAEELFDLWDSLASGPFVSVAHVRGQANAGGMGFVAACDIVLADAKARFALSELLFGLYPACVLPFLIRRVGFQRANYMTVATLPVGVEQAHAWGLVDAYDERSEVLLQRHLLRLRRLSKNSILHYKNYAHGLAPSFRDVRQQAIQNNRDMHLLPEVVEGIVRYVDTGKFPWERN